MNIIKKNKTKCNFHAADFKTTTLNFELLLQRLGQVHC